MSIDNFLPDLGVLDDKAIAHSLEGFSFSKDASNFDTSLFIGSGDDNDGDDDGTGEPFGGDDDVLPMDVDGAFGDAPAGDVEDFFVGDQAPGDDYGNGGFEMGQDDQGGADAVDGANGDDDGAQPSRLGGFEPFDPRRVPNERDLILAMTEPGANGSSLDYFDQTFLKNWAGPEHWKLRKVIRRRKFALRLRAYDE